MYSGILSAGNGFKSKLSAINSAVKNITVDTQTVKQFVLKNSIIGTNSWLLVHRVECSTENGIQTRNFVVLCSVYKNGGLWNYDAVHEDAGLLVYNCPKTILGLADEPVTEMSSIWRKGVLKHSGEAKEARMSPKVGEVWKMIDGFGSNHVMIVESILGTRDFIVVDAQNPDSKKRRVSKDWLGKKEN